MTRNGAFQSEQAIRETVRAKIGYRRTQLHLADELGISRSMLSEFLAGKKNAGPVLLKALGFDPRPHYRRRLIERGLEAEKKGKAK